MHQQYCLPNSESTTFLSINVIFKSEARFAVLTDENALSLYLEIDQIWQENLQEKVNVELSILFDTILLTTAVLWMSVVLLRCYPCALVQLPGGSAPLSHWALWWDWQVCSYPDTPFFPFLEKGVVFPLFQSVVTSSDFTTSQIW